MTCERVVLPATAVHYQMKRVHKPEYWQFITLVAKEGSDKLTTEQIATLTVDDAAFAYCHLCQCTIPARKGNTNAGPHMQAFHRDRIASYLQENEPRKRALEEDIIGGARHAAKKPKAKASREQQSHANNLLALWVANSMRPLAIVEDVGLARYIKFVTDEVGRVDVKIPDRSEMRCWIQALGSDLRKTLLQRLRDECKFYSLTTDIWTDRSMRSFMALTVHYVDEEYELQSWLLGITAFRGKHTGERIESAIDSTLQQWGLDESMCTVIARDGASNAVAATRRIGDGDKALHCIAHALHLVVGAAMIRKSKRNRNQASPAQAATLNAQESDDSNPTARRTTRSTTAAVVTVAPPAIDESHSAVTVRQVELTALIEACTPLTPAGAVPVTVEISSPVEIGGEEEVDEALTEDVEDIDNGLETIERLRELACTNAEAEARNLDTQSHRLALDRTRDTVAKFRAIAAYFSRSSKGRFRFDSIQRLRGKQPKALLLDCPTRWNSTWAMLERFQDLELDVNDFFGHVATTGSEEFSDFKLVRPSISDWLAIKCLVKLLEVFTAVSERLGGEGYPTLVSAFPLLRVLKADLQKAGSLTSAAPSLSSSRLFNTYKMCGERCWRCSEVVLEDST